MKIVAGETNLAAFHAGRSATGVSVRVKQVVVQSDLALLELVSSLDIEENENIEKAVLPMPGMQYRGKVVTRGGWEYQTDDFFTTDTFIQDDQFCINFYDLYDSRTETLFWSSK